MKEQMDLKFTLAIRGEVAGVDEAGRGPLAGPVYAAAVIFRKDEPVFGVADSKKLTGARREELFDRIQQEAAAWSIARAEVEEIDRLNILHATMLAMQRAVAGLSVPPDHVLVDGNRSPEFDCPSTPIVRGDDRVALIGAASILAKVARDRDLLRLDAEYPGYGFARHKGYGTKAHMQALRTLGPCPAHRRSFAPVRNLLQQEGLQPA